MKNIIKNLLIVIVVFISISCSKENNSNNNTVAMFEENADDWFIKGSAQWEFKNGELVGRLDSGGGFIMTKKVYKDFELTLDFKPDSTINSGIFIRCQNDKLSISKCYEVNIWDMHTKQEYRTGAIVNRSSSLVPVNTIGKWNTYKINIKNDHLKTWINDIPTIDLKDTDLVEGKIGLQAALNGVIRFKNIKITEL